jgi:hypothetical protein
MSVLVLDAGNSIIKGKIARREQGEIAFPHVLLPPAPRPDHRIQL